MILQCPECSARFAVPDALMPAEGRTVKCGRCAHQWHAAAPVPVPAPASAGAPAEPTNFADLTVAAIQEVEEVLPPTSPSPSPRKAPVVPVKPVQPGPFIFASFGLLLLGLVMALVAYYPRWVDKPVARSLYGMVGIHSTEGLAFADVNMQRNLMKDGQTQFLISGSISNHAAVARMVPTVRVELKDKDGNTMWARQYVVDEMVDAGGTYPFRIDNVTTSFANHVTSIVLDVGHSLQLAVR